MFRVEVAPDAVCQLEHLTTKRLEYGGRVEAYHFLQMLEECINALKEDPLSESAYMNGFPKRYRVKNVVPEVVLIYQTDEEKACVRVDGVIENF